MILVSYKIYCSNESAAPATAIETLIETVPVVLLHICNVEEVVAVEAGTVYNEVKVVADGFDCRRFRRIQ